jgi:hypothetical protein
VVLKAEAADAETEAGEVVAHTTGGEAMVEEVEAVAMLADVGASHRCIG